MKRSIAARETSDTMHDAEDAMTKALSEAKRALVRLKAAKTELGATGTLGDAAIARWAECVELLDSAQTTMRESHEEAYRVYKMLNIRGVAISPTSGGWISDNEESRVA